MTNTAILIPLFNHGESLVQTVSQLAPFDLPILVVDDGSNLETKTIAVGLAKNYPQLTLLTLPKNQGKGGAVMAGMRFLSAKGFTHAIQVDADGQHDLTDLPILLRTSKQYPDALITGVPKYDESIPKGRLYGRYITHFWVWVETLSLSISDTMCGFRVYPLAPCISLLEQHKLGKRMDFDIEIMVRMYWSGTEIVEVPTRVIYPENGISHFMAWRDNWLISKMHTRLFFGMLTRAPKLLSREQNTGHWATTCERGTSWGLTFMLKAYALFGRPVARLLLYPVIGYFYLTGREAKQASRRYLDRITEHTAQPLSGFKHFLAFGEAALDKVSVWSGHIKLEDINYHRSPALDAALQQGIGGVILGAHLGNIEISRALSGAIPNLKINALVFTRNAVKFNRLLEKINPKANLNLIQVDKVGPETAILLQEKVAAGEYVAILADRISTTQPERAITARFLGEDAPFPQGPFILASLMKCPVYTLFCLKQDGRYHISFEPFADPLELPRASRQQALENAVSEFAKRLEKHCIKAPYQWFNFYDFWHSSKK